MPVKNWSTLDNFSFLTVCISGLVLRMKMNGKKGITSFRFGLRFRERYI